VRPNPKKLNPLQLRTLAILQAVAREPAFAEPPDQDGTVSLHALPHRHGDHLHVGAASVAARDATGLANPNVLNALARKGLLRHGSGGLPSLTPEGRDYPTGIAAAVLQAADH
jgi:ribosomal protein S19E (S16A)